MKKLLVLAMALLPLVVCADPAGGGTAGANPAGCDAIRSQYNGARESVIAARPAIAAFMNCLNARKNPDECASIILMTSVAEYNSYLVAFMRDERALHDAWVAPMAQGQLSCQLQTGWTLPPVENVRLIPQ